jgi:hypothetical protein
MAEAAIRALSMSLSLALPAAVSPKPVSSTPALAATAESLYRDGAPACRRCASRRNGPLSARLPVSFPSWFRPVRSLVAAAAVVVLTGAFLLPTVHHLAGPHHGGHGDHGDLPDCPLCLHAGSGVFAEPAAVPRLLSAPRTTAVPADVAAPVSDRPHRLRASRAPPLSV